MKSWKCAVLFFCAGTEEDFNGDNGFDSDDDGTFDSSEMPKPTSMPEGVPRPGRWTRKSHGLYHNATADSHAIFGEDNGTQAEVNQPPRTSRCGTSRSPNVVAERGRR